MARADHLRTSGQVRGIEQVVKRNVGEFRVGRPLVPVREGELLHLDEGVQISRAVVSHLLHVKSLGHLEQLQLGDPLGVGWEDEHRVVLVLAAERLHPRRGVRRQVRGTHVAAFRLDERSQPVGHGALVEAVLAVPGDALQGGRERRIAQQAADGRRRAAGQVERLSMVVQRARLGPDVARQPRGDGEAVAGVPDGRGKQLLAWQGAESVQGVHPACHRPRHRHRERAVAGHRVESPFAEQGGGGECPGTTAAVHRVDPAARGLVVQCERVASDPVHVRPDHGQHPGHGDRRVHGVAAPAKHVVAGRGGQGMTRRHGTGYTADIGAVCHGDDHLPRSLSAAGLSRGLGLARRQRQEDSGTEEHGWYHAGYGRERTSKSILHRVMVLDRGAKALGCQGLVRVGG